MRHAAAVDGLALRRATADDRSTLLTVHAATRADELDAVPWTDEVRDAFLASQFTLQDAAYRATYPDGPFWVIELRGDPIGRLYLGVLPGEVRIVDIALLPHARGQGIGTALVTEVVAEAVARGLAVTLHVERWNPAWRLYRRTGFVEVEDRGAHVLLRRDPDVS